MSDGLGWNVTEPGKVKPGYHPVHADYGTLVICVDCGPAFGQNALGALRCIAAERAPGPTREVLERLSAAVAEALGGPE